MRLEREDMPMPQLTPAEVERLALLAEECGETVQAIGKILRHGLYSVNPDGNPNWQNYEQLEKEIGDIFASVSLLLNTNIVSASRIDNHRNVKLQKVQQYLHHKP